MKFVGPWASVLVCMLFLAGCTKRNPAVCCTNAADCEALGLPAGSECADGLVCVENGCTDVSCQAASDCPTDAPYCSLDGSCAECLETSQCAAGVCEPTTHSCVACVSSTQCGRQICDTSAHQCVACTADAQCASGLCDVPEGQCLGELTIVPKFTPATCQTTATTGELMITTSTATSSNDALVCNGGVVTQVGGPEICVLRYSKITVAAGGTLKISGLRAVALVADGDVNVGGVIDISADREVNGPGGGTVVDGEATGIDGSGGAGFRTLGGRGGGAAGGVSGGAARPDPMTTGVLVGGPRTPTGGGGGAVTLVSCRGTVALSGLIDAGGGGGFPGLRLQPHSGADGGGADGDIALQGVDVHVSGRAFANGGAGGSGHPNNADKGVVGADGSLSDAVPAVGPPATSGNGRGGGGGFAVSGPANGGVATLANASSGGGGGSTGFLHTATAAGHAPTLAPIAASPMFQPNVTLTAQ